MFDDLCCHIRALLEERERILKRSVKRLRTLELLRDWFKAPMHEDGCDCSFCENAIACDEAIKP